VQSYEKSRLDILQTAQNLIVILRNRLHILTTYHFYCPTFLIRNIFSKFAATLPPRCRKCPVYGQNWVVADGWQVAANREILLIIVFSCWLQCILAENTLYSAREYVVFYARIHRIPTLEYAI